MGALTEGLGAVGGATGTVDTLGALGTLDAGDSTGAGTRGAAQATNSIGNTQRPQRLQVLRRLVRKPITVVGNVRGQDMLLILLEALGAGAIMVFIVWWTMFAGRSDKQQQDDE